MLHPTRFVLLKNRTLFLQEEYGMLAEPDEE